MAVLYRKYRPKKFSEVVGQNHITSALLSALTSGQVAHAYLFVGPKGTGKTTTARILAKALNCEVYSKPLTVNRSRTTDNGQRTTVQKFGEPCGKCVACTSIDSGSWLDLIEIDAASNRTIDDVRELRERIRLAPTSGRYKVYIIDEVHMLTTEAFNALLKTLEEPPSHAFFILCTTEAAKVPPTIVSRTQRFNFKKATVDEIIGMLSAVAKKEGIEVEARTLEAIAASSDGGYRDALSFLDQAWGGKAKLDHDEALSLLTSGGGKSVAKIVEATLAGQLNNVFEIMEKLTLEGANWRKISSEVLELLRHIMLVQSGVQTVEGYVFSEEAQSLAKQYSSAEVLKLTRQVMEMDSFMRTTPIASLPLEMAVASYVVEISDKQSLRSRDLKQEAISGEAGGKKKAIDPSVKEEEEKPEVKVNVKGGYDSEVKSAKEIEVEVKNPQPDPIDPGDLDAVLAKWNQIIERLKPDNLSIVALLRGTKPIGYASGVITLEAFYKFHKDKLENDKVLSLVESVARDVLGQNVRIVCRLGARQAVTVDNAEVVNDDLAQLASEIFAN